MEKIHFLIPGNDNKWVPACGERVGRVTSSSTDKGKVTCPECWDTDIFKNFVDRYLEAKEKPVVEGCGNIEKLSDKNTDLYPYQTEARLESEIMDVIHEYTGAISLVSVIGVLELVKLRTIENNK